LLATCGLKRRSERCGRLECGWSDAGVFLRFNIAQCTSTRSTHWPKLTKAIPRLLVCRVSGCVRPNDWLRAFHARRWRHVSGSNTRAIVHIRFEELLRIESVRSSTSSWKSRDLVESRRYIEAKEVNERRLRTRSYPGVSTCMSFRKKEPARARPFPAVRLLASALL
jgi:hypothetical protein